MRVLSVVHEPGETGGGGLFETTVERRGDELVRWVIPDGAAPGEPSSFDAVMVFGGAMHPDQDAEHPWLPQEAAYLEETLAAGVPLLGVCLGSQMIARAAGSAIGPSVAAEVGWHAIELTEEGRSDPVLGTLPATVEAFQWHYYGWQLPTGGVLLARNDAAPQAFRLGARVWGVQFHPEVTRQMLEAWFAHGAAELPQPAAEMRRELDDRLGPWNTHGRTLCEAFLDHAAGA
jgi:GMP synthase (glutamine-hydrolysing)